MAGVDIDTLTMEQYLALSQENQAPGVVKPEIGGNVNFEIKSQFMRELGKKLSPGIRTRMLTITLTGSSASLAYSIFPESLKTQSCSEFSPLLLLEPQKDGRTDSPQELTIPGISSKRPLSKCIAHLPRPRSSLKIFTTSRKKETNHYINPRSGIMTCYTSALLTTSIVIKRNIGRSSSNEGLAALVNKLDNLGRDMKKLKESVHAIQIWRIWRTTPFNGNSRGRKILAKTIKKYIEEASMRQAKQDEWLKTFCHNLEKSQNHHDEIIQDLESRVTTLSKEAVTKTDKNENCKPIFTNDGAPLYTPFYYSPEEIEYFSANSRFLDDDESKNVTSISDIDLKQTTPKQTITHYIELENDNDWINREWNDWLNIKYGEVDETMKMKILTEHWRKRFEVDYDDINDFYNPYQCEDGRNNEIRERIIHNIHEEWFKGTSDDEDDIEGIIDYLKPTSYDRFIDLNGEEYNKRRCRLLGMPYIEPLPIIIEQVKITRYSLGPGEVYTKLEVSNMEELPRTRNNVTTIRSNIMDEVFENYEDEMT
ncbi:hypothetical protein Tco_1446388 [Tanacetum coccineum]